MFCSCSLNFRHAISHPQCSHTSCLPEALAGISRGSLHFLHEQNRVPGWSSPESMILPISSFLARSLTHQGSQSTPTDSHSISLAPPWRVESRAGVYFSWLSDGALSWGHWEGHRHTLPSATGAPPRCAQQLRSQREKGWGDPSARAMTVASQALSQQQTSREPEPATEPSKPGMVWASALASLHEAEQPVLKGLTAS